jgi:hypothetical protein
MTDRIFSEDNLLLPGRRQLLLASFLAALPLGLSARRAEAINPAETQVTLLDQIKWTAWPAGPPHGTEMATLFGGLDKPGQYVVLMKWYPGYMSAPHSYATDRLCLVLSGTWWVNSGTVFEPTLQERNHPRISAIPGTKFPRGF